MPASPNNAVVAARLCFGLIAGLLASLPARAGLPTEPAEKAQVIGQPAALLAQPETIVLNGPRSTQQVVISGRYANGTVRDLTPFCELAADTPGVVEIEAGGFLVPRKDGATALLIRAGGQTLRVPVTVKDFT